jgi:hypothetical protein
MKSQGQFVKKQAFEAYGGPLCKCCGETIMDFLTIDHINNNGYEHRKKIGGGSKFYYWLRKNKYPKGYRVLCMNCNFGRRTTGNCPHNNGV